jgi:hypothetical protein
MSVRPCRSFSGMAMLGSSSDIQPNVPAFLNPISCPIGMPESKSIITASPMSSSMMLLGFISLCTRPNVLCRKRSPFEMPSRTVTGFRVRSPFKTAPRSDQSYFFKHMAEGANCEHLSSGSMKAKKISYSRVGSCGLTEVAGSPFRNDQITWYPMFILLLRVANPYFVLALLNLQGA